MEWWQAILLGIVQGLTEFLPVSSSGHLMIAKELFGVDSEGFLDFTVLVHFGTVLSTIVVFWSAIWALLKGLFKFKWNDETDYICKIIVSMIPVAVVGFFFKDACPAPTRAASGERRWGASSPTSPPALKAGSGRTGTATASPTSRPSSSA